MSKTSHLTKVKKQILQPCTERQPLFSYKEDINTKYEEINEGFKGCFGVGGYTIGLWIN